MLFGSCLRCLAHGAGRGAVAAPPARGRSPWHRVSSTVLPAAAAGATGSQSMAALGPAPGPANICIAGAPCTGQGQQTSTATTHLAIRSPPTPGGAHPSWGTPGLPTHPVPARASAHGQQPHADPGGLAVTRVTSCHPPVPALATAGGADLQDPLAQSPQPCQSCAPRGHRGCPSHALCPKGTSWLGPDLAVLCRDTWATPAIPCAPWGHCGCPSHALCPMGTLWLYQPCPVPHGALWPCQPCPAGHPGRASLALSPCGAIVPEPGSAGL